MEKLTDIELTSIEATDPKPKSFANNVNAILIQVFGLYQWIFVKKAFY